MGKEPQVSGTPHGPGDIEYVPAPHAPAGTGQEAQGTGLGIAACLSDRQQVAPRHRGAEGDA